MMVPSPHSSLRSRLSSWLAVQAALGLGLVSVVVYVVIAWTLSERQDEILAQKREAVQRLLGQAGDAADISQVRHLLKDFLAGHAELSLRIAASDGRLLYEAIGQSASPEHSKALAFDVGRPGALPSSARATLMLDRRLDRSLLERLAWTLSIAAFAGTLAVSAAGFWLVRRGLSPLDALVRQTNRITALELERRLDGSGQVKELQPLIVQFNGLLDRLGAAYRQMESFNADVAHELNTPLSTLISSCELALRRPRSHEELKEILASNLEELREVAGIVADMLFLSNAERGVPARRGRPSSVAALVRDVVDFHEAALQEAGLGAAVDGDAFAALDTPLVRRAVSNLLSNATRYAAAGSVVRVQVESCADGDVVIAVSNDGQNVEPQHLARLFDRFYRADAARNRSSGHHGLGLSIVAAIAKMHAGSTFASSDAGRTRIGFTLRAS